jgi:hypothetical protein
MQAASAPKVQDSGKQDTLVGVPYFIVQGTGIFLFSASATLRAFLAPHHLASLKSVLIEQLNTANEIKLNHQYAHFNILLPR